LLAVAIRGVATLSLANGTVNEITAAVLMPRTYILARRAEQQAATRTRILDAALGIYRERGFAAATTQAVAAAADVAPGTVRNHFPTPLDLAAAAGERILEDTGLPGIEIFEGHTTVAERVGLLARELAGFFERSASSWQVREGNPDLASAWVRAETRYDDHVAGLAAAAIEPGGADAATASIVVTLVGGPLYYRLRAAGLSEDETVAVELSLLLPWLEDQSS
jgi:AcrR family transcriptional regulator